MCAPEERQGYLGNIEAKSVPELKELLERQQKILNKKRFLQTLPDKGRKVGEFAVYLQQLITRKGGELPPSLQDSSSQTDRLGQNGSEVHTSSSSLSNKPPVSSDHNLESRLTVHEKNKITLASEINNVPYSTCPESPKTSHKVASDFSRLRDRDVPMDHLSTCQSQKVTSLHEDNRIDECMVKQKDNKTEKNSFESEMIDEQNKSSAELVQMISDIDLNHCIRENSLDQHQEVKQKVMENATDISKCFRPNRTLKITDIHDLPEKYLHKSRHLSDSQHPNRKQVPRVHEDSAATPPSYSYDTSKVISLSESVELQKHQQARQLELQAKQAALRLSERLNVKMDSFSPEGADMTYRIPQQEVVDSDDEPEVEGYNDS